MKPFLKLDISIKFRAMGITFGNWSDKVTFPLPPVFQLLSAFVSGAHVGEYNDHGVKVVATLVDNPLGI